MNKILHSRIIGEGEPLLILHGFLGMGDNWRSMAKEYVNSGYQVHLIDQRNHGRSFHSDDFSYELMVEDLLAYCNYYSLGIVSILGHSMGGKVAMLFAVTFPEKLNKIIIADIGPKSYPPHHHNILDAINSVNFKVQSKRAEVDKKLAEFIPNIGVRSFLLKSVFWKEKGVLDFRFNVKVLTEKYEEVGEALPTFMTFEEEILFVKGEHSSYIQDTDLTNLKKHFPKYQLVKISKAGHWLHAENPKEFLKFTLLYLKS